MQYHPDKCKDCDEKQREQNEEKFVKVAEAYAILSDDKKVRLPPLESVIFSISRIVSHRPGFQSDHKN